MNDVEIQRFIHLLHKLRGDTLTWGETCELREMKYAFADAIELYWEEFSTVNL